MIRRHHHDEPLDPVVAAELEELEAALAGRAGADPDLAALVRDVRAGTPAPDEDFVRGLGERVAAGFPRPSRRDRLAGAWTRLRHGLAWRPALAVAAAALLALVVALAALPGADEPTRTDGGESVIAAPESAEAPAEAERGVPSASPEADAVEPGIAPIPPVPGPEPVPLDGPRYVDRSADIALRTEPGRVQEVADGVVRVTKGLGGVVASSRIAARDDGGEATFDLRVPTERLDRAVAELSALASVARLEEATTDVTGAFVSAEDRLEDARDERDALLRALERVDSDREAARLREQLRDARAEIARAEAELRALRTRSESARIAVTVAPGPDGDAGGAGAPGPWTPGDAADDALRVLEVAAGVAIVAAAVLAPLALLALLGLLAARLSRRRGRQRALDGAAP